MADTKISALTGASTPLAGTEVLPIVQGSATVKVSVANLTAGRAVSVLELNSSGNVNVFASNATRLYTTNNANYCTFYNAGTTTANDIRLNTDAGNLIKATDTGLTFPLGATFSTNNLTQGTAAKGVNFTANTPAAGMTSQLLNAYEEGTWTPTIGATTTGNLAVTYSLRNGSYTRIGRQVTVQALIATSAFTHTTASGEFRLSGLPFNPNATVIQPDTALGFSGITKAGYTNFTIFPAPSVDYLRVRASASGVANAVLSITDFPTGGAVVLLFSATYFV